MPWRAASSQNACSVGPGNGCAVLRNGPSTHSSLNRTICTQGKRCISTSTRWVIAARLLWVAETVI